jgi:cytidylate kinase
VSHRVERICGRVGCRAKEAVGLAHRVDAERVSYLRQFYGRDWRDPTMYDLQINTGRLTLDEVASAIVALVESRDASPDEVAAHG